MIRRKRWMITALGVGLSLVATIAPTASAQAPKSKARQIAELVAKANKEGALNLDLFVIDAEAREQVKAFSKMYPKIKVTYRRNNTAPMRALEEQEIAAGRANFDVVATSGARDLADWEKKGRLLPLTDVPSYKDLPKDWQISKTRAGFYLGMAGVFYNTKALKGNPPRSLAEIPNGTLFTGKIGIADPLNAGSQGVFVSVNDRTLGPNQADNLQFFRQIGAIRPRLFRSTTDSSQALASGEIWMSFNMPLSVAADIYSKGAPVALAPMKDMPYFLAETAIYSKAKHPNAAKLWTEFLIGSAQGDKVLRNNSKIGPLSYGETDWAKLHPLLKGIRSSMLRTVKPEDIKDTRLRAIAKAYGF